MKLLQARKGQFVYFNNELHKIYSVKPILKQSLHMYRIKDMQQVLARTDEVVQVKPKPNDSLIFWGKRYTLRDDVQPKENGYILITKPAPDYLDHYSLNEFEKVDQVKDDHVITTRRNSVQMNEFLVLVPGKEDSQNDIAYQDPSLVTAQQMSEDENLETILTGESAYAASIGDIYANSSRDIRAMVVAIVGDKAVLGHGEQIPLKELTQSEDWLLVLSVETEEA
ncbi:hypothetical protein [Planococcus lenghuensis]|uniref:Uncharacterized protein n=1 Tax=Planococcus lenghuensis TaxID=2213202 RepID=A0A1Q2KUR4_9BACL|nr:hypothetical protein [Planococcus lenghuensis]AQQ51950.1 hypothetical protein B0X71_01650 [Planococcus lenghuensis]